MDGSTVKALQTVSPQGLRRWRNTRHGYHGRHANVDNWALGFSNSDILFLTLHCFHDFLIGVAHLPNKPAHSSLSFVLDCTYLLWHFWGLWESEYVLKAKWISLNRPSVYFKLLYTCPLQSWFGWSSILLTSPFLTFMSLRALLVQISCTSLLWPWMTMKKLCPSSADSSRGARWGKKNTWLFECNGLLSTWASYLPDCFMVKQ